MHDWNKDDNRAAKLLCLLMDDATDSGTKEKIRAWFWSDVSRKAKHSAIIEQFRQMMPNPAPEEYDHEKYAELTAALNMGSTAAMPVRKKRSNLFLRVPMRIAAAVIVLLGISGITYLLINNARDTVEDIAEVTVSAGSSVQSIQLPDGSSVELQANSKLTYDENFTSGRRVLLDGEAILTVEKSMDEAGEPIPFSVITDDLEVDVHGTVFRIIDPSDDNDDRSIVALYDGSVSVAAKDATIVLNRGETYHYDHMTKESNIGLILAKEMLEHGFMPLLRFEDSTLGNLITSLAANHKVEFELPDDVDLSKGRFSGDFQSEDLESTLNILTKSSKKLNFRLKGDKVFVERK